MRFEFYLVFVLFYVCDGLVLDKTGLCAKTISVSYKRRFPCPHNKARTCAKTDYRNEDRLMCCKDYKLVEGKCEPVCAPGCVHAVCAAPHQCECLPGHRHANSTHCEPICTNCTNGQCVAPETCECDPGYEKRGGTCSPICDTICANGDCTSPNICTCHAGYKHNDTNKYHCLPTCEPECVNAVCASPNTCTCYPGYESKDGFTSSTCKPICDRCENGECVSPGNCACHEGYEHIGGKCTPKCAQSCEHGDCTAPNECTCHVGYAHSDPFTCKPVCSPSCVNATCVAPGRCVCNKHYKPITESDIDIRVCKPYCKNCENGDCVEPRNCRCHKGYAKVDGICTPVCSEECKNGVCTAPDQCTCPNGYKQNHLNKFLCDPVCIPQCQNSTCVTPSKCDCWPGYQRTDVYACAPKCSSCSNGDCVAPDQCQCHNGYRPNDNKTSCLLQELIPCDDCRGICNETSCYCENGKDQCQYYSKPEPITTPGLAGLGMTWIYAGAVGFLVLVLVLVVMQRLWTKHKGHNKTVDEGYNGSVVHYTIPDALISRSGAAVDLDPAEVEDDQAAREGLVDDGSRTPYP